MTTRAILALAAIICAFCPAPSRAGACANDLYQAEVAINRELDAIAARGKAAAESTFATSHHQPTPATVAGAEAQVGDVSDSQVQAVRTFMLEARAADDRGDTNGCEAALVKAKKVLGM